MLRFTALSATALLVAAPAFAGGVAPPPPPPVIVPVAEDDWTEFYIGGQVDLIASAEVSDPGGVFGEFEGHLIGVFAGYRYDFGDIVVGGEIDYMVGTLDFNPNSLQDEPFSADTTLVRVGLEVGYDLGDALVYGTGGYAHIDLEPDIGGSSLSDDGYFFGAGLDYRVSESIVVGAEVLYHFFDELDGAELEATTVGLNVAFTF